MRKLICALFLGLTFNVSAQLDTIKVLSYNLLNFPNMVPERIDTLKDILQQIAAALQPQIVQQQTQDIAVPRIADRAIGHRPRLALQRFRQSAQATRGIEAFILHTVMA